MAKRNTESPADKMRQVRHYGVEQTMPGTYRKVKLKAVDASDLLRENKMPNILTPLITGAIYQDLNTRDLRDYTTQDRGSVEGAIEMLDSIDFIVKKAIADDTKVDELTLAEKKWIFQLVLGPAEVLANFRLQQEPDVEALADGEDVQPATE